jgi:hypothetical protein
MQQALLPTDAGKVMFRLPTDTPVNELVDAFDLQQLGERLRGAYGPVEAPLPARLAELVERLVRHENSKNSVWV